MPNTWQGISRRKKQEQLFRIPKDYLLPKYRSSSYNVLDVPRSCGLLTVQEISITEDYDATALAEAIQSKALTSVEVTRAFCKRAAIAHQLVLVSS
jgi:amidase